jgi:phage gp36-like protein
VSYTTLSALTDKFGEPMLVALTDRGELATNTVDLDVINRAITDAAAMIDGYVSVRYALPMLEVPDLIGRLALAIAIYDLHVSSPDDKIKNDYEAALKTLMQISSGAVRLPIDGKPAAETGGSGARVTDRQRPMTAESLKGFI